jgi:glycosyltransferase involved in cell wall biosynthesis
VSEKDKGIYDAMNKGILQAEGEYLLFLNSGDYLIDKEVLNKVFERQLTEDIVYGDIIWDTNGKHTNARFPDTLSFEFLTTNSLAHQAAFFKKELFDKTGLYDEQYSIVADWVLFLLAVYKHNCSYLHLEELICVCSRDGISCLADNWPKIVKDRKKATHQNFAAFEKDFDKFYSLRDEFTKLQNELQVAKLTFGYRLQKKIQRILKSSINK